MEKNIETAQGIEHGHKRHQRRADAGNALHAEDHDKSHGKGHAEGNPVGGNAESLAAEQRDGVALHHVADAERGKDGKKGKEHGQPLETQTAMQRVHRAADHMTVVGLHTILYGQE